MTCSFTPPPPRAELKWCAVDLDGTIARGVWTPDNPTSLVGDPISHNVVKLRDLHARGWKIAIHTARPWNDYEAIESWVERWSIPVDRIICGKLLAAAYIDDQAIHAEHPDWTPPEALAKGKVSPSC